MKLYEFLAAHGIASLSESKQLIKDQKVKVSGEIVTNPLTLVKNDDYVEYNNELVEEITNKEYFILNKPEGYTSSISQKFQKRDIRSLFEGEKNKVYPIDYLDFDSEGLVIFTNDPSFEEAINKKTDIEKEYEIKVRGLLRKEDSRKIGDANFRILNVKYDELKENTYLSVITKGIEVKEIRQKFSSVNHDVKKLRRIRFGNILLDVPKGKYRMMKPHEVKLLRLLSMQNQKKVKQ